MTMKEKIKLHTQIERENAQKLEAWKAEKPRTYYSVYYLDDDCFWKVGSYRVNFGRIKVQMVEAVYRMWTETKIVKETFYWTGRKQNGFNIYDVVEKVC